MGDEDDAHPELLAAAGEQIEDLGLDGHVERGGRLVGDEQLGLAGERHGDHHPLAHAARELVRVRVDARLGRGDADEVEHLDRSFCARRARETFWWSRIASMIWLPTV